jgi:hypothetical protein
MIGLALSMALLSTPQGEMQTLQTVLRAHQEQHTGRPCAEWEDGPGCNCLELARLIESDLRAMGYWVRIVTLVRKDTRPFPDGVIPAHAVVWTVDGKMLDPESWWVKPANSYRRLWTEYKTNTGD